MSQNIDDRKANLGHEWVKSAKTGDSYLCPIGAISDKSKASDEELRRYCVNESDNPQNS